MKLTVFFKSQATRNLALKAVKEVFGEDGWRYMTPVENKGYPADIYCCAASDAEKTFIKSKLEEIMNFCKDRGIKIGYHADNLSVVAGHVDDISYDDFDSDEDSHFDVSFMDSFNSPFCYLNDDYEFVLRGDKKKED